MLLPFHLIIQHSHNQLMSLTTKNCTDLVRMFQITPERTISKFNFFLHSHNQFGRHFINWVWTTVFSCDVFSFLIVNQIKSAIDWCICFLKYNIRLCGKLCVCHHSTNTICRTDTGSITHKLQTDLFKMTSLCCQPYFLCLENFAFSFVHIKTNGTNYPSGCTGQ